jgi:NitT/TauT family transport system substrate-binding protein
MINRRRLLAAASAATAVSLFPRRPARADDTVRIGTLTIDNTAEVFYAQELGMFAKAGLTVDIQIFQSGPASAAALAGGAIDLGIADSVSMASAHARGLPLTYIAPATIYTKANPSHVLMVPVNSPIKSAKDFNGKTLAVNGIKNILQVPTEAWIDNNGGDSKSVKFVEVPFPAMGPAIIAGTINGASVSEPFITNFLDGGKLRAISVADKNVAPEFMFSGWTTTSDWATKHPDAVRKLVGVFAEAAKWGNANHAQSAQILVKASKMPAEVANKMVRAYYGERLDAALLQPVIDACAKYGTIAKSFPAAEVFSPVALR